MTAIGEITGVDVAAAMPLRCAARYQLAITGEDSVSADT